MKRKPLSKRAAKDIGELINTLKVARDMARSRSTDADKFRLWVDAERDAAAALAEYGIDVVHLAQYVRN